MAYVHALVGAEQFQAHPTVRRIGIKDIQDALIRGVEDFAAMPSHAVFLCLIYPMLGLVLARFAFGYEVLPLIYPLIAGFALLGPFAGLGLYELSRRREQGLEASASDAFDVLHHPSIGAIALLGLLLLAIFAAWLVTAQTLYHALFGPAAPDSMMQFLNQVLTTRAGWMLMIVGNAVGFLFALLVLTTTVIAFPMLLDRDVGALEAILTSVRAVIANPIPMALWGLIVAGALVLGALPAFLGLAVVMPILGHSTWHLYRKLVAPDPGRQAELPPRVERRRYAADFPVNLLPWGGEDRR